MINKAISILIIFFAIFSFAEAQGISQLGPAETEVIFAGSSRVFPCKWKKKKIKARAEALDTAEYKRSMAAIEAALAKYPQLLLENNLKRIYVFRFMSFFKLEYGGTYNNKNVYLTNNGAENGYSNAYIEGTFHHEFSSILLKRHTKAFDKQAWQKANPEDFTYGNGGIEALKTEHTSLRLDSSLFDMGFLNPYSLASMEEDFNCYAEYLFLGDEDFWNAWENSEAIREKTAIIISFFHQLDKQYCLEYFKSLSD